MRSIGILIFICDLVLGEVTLAGTYGRISADDGSEIEMVFQEPGIRSKKGILLMLHGCHHRATDMWPSSEWCPKCLGLPIETKIVLEALRKGWVVVAVSSMNEERKCWSEADHPRLVKVVDTLIARTKAPRYVAAIGASSGGSMATSLRIEGLIGVVCQIMSTHGRPDHPPTRFVHMRRDERRATHIDRQVGTLHNQGIDVEQYLVKPSPISAGRFWPGPGGTPPLPTKKLADDLMTALLRGHVIDNRGYLLQDPRHSDWRYIVRSVVPTSIDTLQPDVSPIAEILNAAYAWHEFTDEFLSECLDWLDSRRALSYS